ncbi:tetratricopeptide repeat protein [Algoriphagus zhangzhouensis]|uniref:Tetratricopeptide repeat-containing protein n=2 Tax=Algoriphagus zhangzhouensis TaxID=1073327 RepID=A0A1M7ZDR9_9BACT|nr:tetratricopeptide repeat protein [Algoriphagus zhangzhouensis]SHO62826.1 Tetratricopeptide repeat-containing protein [Algoriphagus zhangzhouensis]
MRMSKHLHYQLFFISGLLLFLAFEGRGQTHKIKPDFEQSLLDARMSFHRTYYENASHLFDQLILMKEDHALAHAYMALIDFMLYKDPSLHIERALTLTDESDPNNSITLALCSFASGDYWGCESNIKEFLIKDPENQFGSHLLAMTLIAMDRAEEGKITLIDLLKRNKEYFPAYNHMGYACLKLNQKEEAIQAFETFLQKDSLNPSAYDSYAEAWFESGNTEKAIACLNKAVKLDPYFAYGWNHMGDILYQMGETQMAINAFEKGKKAAKYYGPEFTESLNQKLEDLKKEH